MGRIASLACILILSSEVSAGETVELRGVLAQEVWDDLRSKQTVSFSVVRDTAQFLLINTAWITAGILLWRGPAVTREDITTGKEGEEVTLLQDRLTTQPIDMSRLNNFFMNPNKVARNLFVSTSLVGNSKSNKSSGTSIQYISVLDDFRLLVPPVSPVEEDLSVRSPDTWSPV